MGVSVLDYMVEVAVELDLALGEADVVAELARELTLEDLAEARLQAKQIRFVKEAAVVCEARLAARQVDWETVVEVLLAYLHFLMEQKDMPVPQVSSPVENSSTSKARRGARLNALSAFGGLLRVFERKIDSSEFVNFNDFDGNDLSEFYHVLDFVHAIGGELRNMH